MTRIQCPRPFAVCLVAVLAVGAVLLAPAADARAVTRSLSISASPGAGLAKSPVTFSGRLTHSPKGSAVKIQRKVGKVWKNVKSTSTKTAAGSYSVAVTLPATVGTYSFRSFAPRHNKLKAAYSSVRKVTALRRTTFTRPDGVNDFVMLVVEQGQPTKALGHLNKVYTAGAIVVLQKMITIDHWTNVGTSTVASDGSFQVGYANAQDGSFRVVVGRKGYNAAATSRTESFDFGTPSG